MPDRPAGLSRCTERASPLSPVLCPAQCRLRRPRRVYSLVGEGSLVPSPGTQAALSELVQIGDPGSLGLAIPCNFRLGLHRGPSFRALTAAGECSLLQRHRLALDRRSGGAEPSRDPPAPRGGLGAVEEIKCKSGTTRRFANALPAPPRVATTCAWPGSPQVPGVWGHAGVLSGIRPGDFLPDPWT